jgi:hypothetical protein
LVLALMFGFSLPPTLAAGTQAGECVSAQVPSAFVLPDGTRGEAGPIRLCIARRLTPVSDLYEIRVGRGPARLFRTQRSEVEEYGESPRFVFRRTVGGEMVLVSVRTEAGRTVSRIFAPGSVPGDGSERRYGRRNLAP